MSRSQESSEALFEWKRHDIYDLTAVEGRKASRVQRLWSSALTHLCICILYLSAVTIGLGMRGTKSSLHVFQNEAISVDVQAFPTIEDSPFFGGSNEEIDAAFESLLARPNLKVSDSELRLEGKHSLKLQESEGYLAWIGAHHDIHCVHLLRKSLHREYYFADADEHAIKQLKQHTDHCLYQLMQTVMCFGDTRLMTFEWNANVSKPILKLSATTDNRQCVDWERLDRSLRDRAIAPEEMGRLERPKLV